MNLQVCSGLNPWSGEHLASLVRPLMSGRSSLLGFLKNREGDGGCDGHSGTATVEGISRVLCAWSARIVASLTVYSHKEDRFGVAQLSGSNAAVLSVLLSCLLAVETVIGKRTNLQSSHYKMGPTGIKWAALSTEKRDLAVRVMAKKRGSLLYSKAYSMADILKTSIYCIVSAFNDELLNIAKAGLLEKDWIIGRKPIYGTPELLSQKLRLFLDIQAS
ncbi:unnamed protein product [Ilex paraguariensis]|uniref:Uncharacterized protein n=1 Tax=Ilex paraguariensis TaxID=185542 RepID=A0ABC8QW53_9AQUA